MRCPRCSNMEDSNFVIIHQKGKEYGDLLCNCGQQIQKLNRLERRLWVRKGAKLVKEVKK